MMSRDTALSILQRCNVNSSVNFYALGSDQVERLLMAAREAKYRHPKNANGSRARYFHARLIRAINRKE